MKCDCEPTVYADGSRTHENHCEVAPWCPHEVGWSACLMPCNCGCGACKELSAAYVAPPPPEEEPQHVGT